MINSEKNISALIQSGEYDIPECGIKLSVLVSENYSKLVINGKEIFFLRETGEYDGWAEKMGPDGPILITSV